MANPLIGKRLVLSGVINEDFLWSITQITGVPPHDSLMTEELIREALLSTGAAKTGLTTVEFESTGAAPDLERVAREIAQVAWVDPGLSEAFADGNEDELVRRLSLLTAAILRKHFPSKE